MHELDRYKLAYAEYRAEVELGSRRQLWFLALGPALVALASRGIRHELVIGTLLLAACVSAAGIVVVRRSHERYRRVRDVLLSQVRELGVEGDWRATGGMGGPREGVRVVVAVEAVLWVSLAVEGWLVAWVVA